VAILGSIGLVALSHALLVRAGLGPIEPLPMSALLAHFGMVQAQLPGTAGYLFYYNANLWSLETEAQLYAVYLLLLPLSRRFGWTRLLSLFAVADVLYLFARDRWIHSFELAWVSYTFFLPHLYIWCLGAYLAEAFFARGGTASVVKVVGWNTLLVVAPLLLLPFRGPGVVTVMSLVFAGMFALALWHALRREAHGEPGASATGALRNAVRDRLAGVGERSYSLYLWHAPVLRLVLVAGLVGLPWLGASYLAGLVLAVVGAVVAYLAGWLAFLAVEKHCLANRTGKVVVETAAPPARAAWDVQAA
jgi:peptidoglycan/LPS O-acetylase OafA/YrhL